MKMIKTNILSIALVGAVVLMNSCKGGDAKKADQPKADSTATGKIKTVAVTTLTPQLFNSYIDIQGKVDADENAAVNAEMAGTVSKIYTHLGEEVKVGQTLAELDGKIVLQGIAELQNALDLAKTMYDKQKNLWDQKIGTEMQFITAKNQKESLEKKMATLQAQLKMTKIISPINGVVDAIDIKIGQATTPGLPAIRVINMSSLKVKGEVSESYMSKINKGDKVKILFPDMQDSTIARISYAAKVISPLDRTFTVTINLDEMKNLHPNMIAILKIVGYSNPKAFVVPVNTIQQAKEGAFVFIAQGNKAKRVPVKVGHIYNGNAEITEGLKEGSKLITRGYQELNDGEAIGY